MFNKKGVLKIFAKLTGNHLWWSLSFLITFLTFFFNNVCFKISNTVFFLSVLQKFWDRLFYRILPGDCFWIGLMVKKFNYVSLIFLNLQLNDAPPEWSLLFWYNFILENIGVQFCNRDYLCMKPPWARFDFFQNLGCIGSISTGKQRHVFWNV